MNSRLNTPNLTAYIFFRIAAFKYRFTHYIAGYTCFELFSDPDQTLTGPIENENHSLTELDLLGGTLGFEYKPIPNAFVRLESRVLSTKASERIFYYNNQSNNIRWEGIASIGLWF